MKDKDKTIYLTLDEFTALLGLNMALSRVCLVPKKDFTYELLEPVLDDISEALSEIVTKKYDEFFMEVE